MLFVLLLLVFNILIESSNLKVNANALSYRKINKRAEIDKVTKFVDPLIGTQNDLSHILTQGGSSKFRGGSIYTVSPSQITGVGHYSGGWNEGSKYSIYFCSQFNKNSSSFGTFWKNFITEKSTFQSSFDIPFDTPAIAKNHSTENIYVQSVKLNGVNWYKTWFRHQDIKNGGILEVEMGDEVSTTWGVNNKENGESIVPP
ncbi:19223_t:CDS:2, partial [Dentiscutata erythropus]